FAFASYYSSGMVLQRSPRRASIWGYAPLGTVGQAVKLTVSSANSTASFEAKVSIGVWRVQLKEMPGSLTSYVITASLASRPSIKISDVLFGDVWLCSGQSNMVFKVGQIFNKTMEYELASHFPYIRLTLVSTVQSNVTLYDIQRYDMKWAKPSKIQNFHSTETVENFSAVCWLYARHIFSEIKVPMGMITSAWGGTPVESWSSPESLSSCGLRSKLTGVDSPPHVNYVLYNAMIHPFLNMTIYGALWYQGEANANLNRDLYNCTFPAMIDDWRTKWNEGTFALTDPTFPFGFVQLGPNTNTSYVPGFSDIRWHQTADIGTVPNNRLKNVFMATAVDLTDLNSPYYPVHYRDKETVGERLALSGLAVAYGRKDVKFQGPLPTDAVIDKTKLQIQIIYDNNQTPLLKIKSSLGFELCCKASKENPCAMSGDEWTATPVAGFNSTAVTLNASACANKFLLGARYIWRETPCFYKKCPVYSVKNDLPAPPFFYLGDMDGFTGERGKTVVHFSN
ncbi:hypothetical protein CAPTEDRAFT_112206, partial [Capitella teleta]